jgi:hypothetical protein
MELLNYLRHKEQNITPNVRNSSRNCSINVLRMKCLISESQLSLIKNHKDVTPAMFMLVLNIENDYSHFEGTELLNADHGSGASKNPKPTIKSVKTTKIAPNPPSPHAKIPSVTVPGISKPTQTKPALSKPSQPKSSPKPAPSKPE